MNDQEKLHSHIEDQHTAPRGKGQSMTSITL